MPNRYDKFYFFEPGQDRRYFAYLCVIVLFIVVGVVGDCITGCSSASSSPMPLMGRGVITANHDNYVWMTYEDGQMAEYHLCDDSFNMADVGEGVDIQWVWNSSYKCFTQKDMFHVKELDVKKADSK